MRSYLPRDTKRLQELVLEQKAKVERIAVALMADAAALRGLEIAMAKRLLESRGIWRRGCEVTVGFSDGAQVCQYEGVEFCNFDMAACVLLRHKTKGGRWSKRVFKHRMNVIQHMQPVSESQSPKEA